MLENLLRGRRSASAQFLAAYARLYVVYDSVERLVFIPERGRVSHLGFAKNYNSELFGCAPRAEPAAQGQSYTDKFIEIRASDQRWCLGSAELKEEHVYDEQYRCGIDFTGLQLVLTCAGPRSSNISALSAPRACPLWGPARGPGTAICSSSSLRRYSNFQQGAVALPPILRPKRLRRKSASSGRSEASVSIP
jgi:hypothetical protein